MIEYVSNMALPVDERFQIKKNRIAPEQLNENAKRICIV